MPYGDGPDRDGADPCGDGSPEGWRIAAFGTGIDRRIATGPEGGAVLHDLEADDWRFEIRAMGLTGRAGPVTVYRRHVGKVSGALPRLPGLSRRRSRRRCILPGGRRTAAG